MQPVRRAKQRSLWLQEELRREPEARGKLVLQAVLRREADLNAGRVSGPLVRLLHRFVPSGLREAGPYAPPD